MPTNIVEAKYTGEAGQEYALRFDENPLHDILGRCFHDRFGNWVSTDDKVLDYGCGTGRNVLALECAERAGYDINEHSLGRASIAGLRVFERTEDIPKEYWSIVVCNHVLEHMASPLETLQVIKSLLAPDGKLILTVPLQGHLLRLVPFSQDMDHHLFCWNPTTMRNLLSAAGFKAHRIVVRKAALENRLRPVSRVSWKLFKFTVWTAGIVLRRREMSTLAELN